MNATDTEQDTQALEAALPEWARRPMFCFGKHSDAYRVRQLAVNPAELIPGERFGFDTSWQLAALSLRDVPQTAKKGSVWCGFGSVLPTTDMASLVIPGEVKSSDNRFVFRVRPRSADEIYMADQRQFELVRQQLLEAALDEGRGLTDAEVNLAEAARARTITPIGDYDGRFVQPVVLISRRLDLSEIQLVSGPWPYCGLVSVIHDLDEKARGLLEDTILNAETRLSNWRDPIATALYENAHEALTVHLLTKRSALEAAVARYPRPNRPPYRIDANLVAHIAQAAGDMRRYGLL